MAKEKKVEQITDMEVDFAQWFTDVCKKAQLIDYSSIKGIFVYRPYGYAIWENIQHIMDAEFKKVGVQNVYMPMLIPESLLQKEKDHVEGFAPECAWVTMGGNERLEERLCIRPTSETLFCDYFAQVIQSHRDLPMKYNQWCSVLLDQCGCQCCCFIGGNTAGNTQQNGFSLQHIVSSRMVSVYYSRNIECCKARKRKDKPIGNFCRCYNDV